MTAADRDGQFWHLAVGAAAGALLGGSVEAARQYISTGKIEDWGRVGSAASGGAVTGTITAANPAVALGSMMGVGAASGAAGGATARLVQSGGKDAGTLTDLMVDTTVGAATAGIVKGGSTLLRKVAPAKPVAPPTSKMPVAQGGGTLDTVRLFHGSIDSASAIQRNGLDPLRTPTWVTTSRPAAENAIGPSRVLSSGQGADRGIIESLVPRGQFESLQKSGGISQTRSWPGFGTRENLTENVLRTEDAVELFNKGIQR